MLMLESSFGFRNGHHSNTRPKLNREFSASLNSSLIPVLLADKVRMQMADPWRVNAKANAETLDSKSLGLGLHVCHCILQVGGMPQGQRRKGACS